MPPVAIQIGGLSLSVPEFLYAYAYLARAFRTDDGEPVEQFLSISLDEALEWLTSNTPENGHGDVAIYDIQFVRKRPPTMVKTIPARR